MTRQLLADGALPVRFWPHAACHAAYLYNRLAHSGLDSQFSPFTALYGVLPRYHYLRPFGSLAFFKALPRPDKLSSRQAHLGVYLGYCPTSEANLYWNPTCDRIVSSVSTRHLPTTNYADFDRYYTTSPSARSSEVTPLSHPVVPPDLFTFAVPSCPSCALERAYLAIRAAQKPLDTNLYEHNPVCDKCETGGTLICCDFCNIVYHATCIPGMRAHVPAAGFVCEECHAQTFPDRQQEYAQILAGRVLRARYANSPDSTGMANGFSADAVADASAERPLQDATDLVADAPAARVPSSTPADDAAATVECTRASSATGSCALRSQRTAAEADAATPVVPSTRAARGSRRSTTAVLRSIDVSARRTRGSVGARGGTDAHASGVVAPDYAPILPRRRSYLCVRSSPPGRYLPPSPARPTLRSCVAPPPLALAAYHPSPTDDAAINQAITHGGSSAADSGLLRYIVTKGYPCSPLFCS
jgi:hypothetical protein